MSGTPANSIIGVLQQVVDLLTDEVSGCAVSPLPCRTFVSPGATVAWDTCGAATCTDRDGQLWANLVSFNATGFEPCQRITFTANVGIVRCSKSNIKDDGNLPSIDEIEADAVQQAADADAIWNLFNCCEDRPDSLRDLSLVNWTALGPNGGCVGGQWTVTGVLDVCC